LGSAGVSQSSSTSDQSAVITCNQATAAEAKSGQPFRGAIINQDYAFSAHVPHGLTGWTGAAQSAPFHGFTIFLDEQMKACIIFEVHLRVNPDEAPKHGSSASSVRLGKATGWRSDYGGKIGSSSLRNIVTVFSFVQPDQVDDGEVLLVSPVARLPENQALYQRFVRSLKFGQ
jgi:hypothetical protein